MSERRYDPTSDEWVTFATHRQHRMFLPAADRCPLCPWRGGFESASEITRPDYEIAVFDNRFPSMQPTPPPPDLVSNAPFLVEPATGRCEVVAYSCDHSTTLARAGYDTVRLLVDVWADRYQVLGAEGHAYVLPFENKGEVTGVTLHHPHGQIYAFPEVPPRPLREFSAAARYRTSSGRCVECDVVRAEEEWADRVVVLGEEWVAHVPFWARFPYEVRITPRSHTPTLVDVDVAGRDDLARILVAVLRGLDGLFGFSMPYVLGLFGRPTGDDPARAGWEGDWDDISHLHLLISPPHRSATQLKYLAGVELMGGSFVTDVSPEQAALTLRHSIADIA